MLIRVGELMVAQIIGKIFHFARFFQLFILKWEDCICREKKKKKKMWKNNNKPYVSFAAINHALCTNSSKLNKKSLTV